MPLSLKVNACDGIVHVVDPRGSHEMESHDVASIICQALPRRAPRSGWRGRWMAEAYTRPILSSTWATTLYLVELGGQENNVPGPWGSMNIKK